MLIGGSKCAFAGEGCEGRLEWHHAVKQQRLRREFKYGAARIDDRFKWVPESRYGSSLAEHRTLDDILGDTRNRVWLCSRHHEKVTNGRLKVELPQSVFEFADEFGLRGMLENDLRRAA